MVLLIILVAATVLARLVGQLGVLPLREWHGATRVGLAVMFCVTGGAHFTGMRADMIRMVPPVVPNPGFMVTLTGICEILGGIGLLVPRTRHVAAGALIVLLMAVLPANIHAALSGITFQGAPAIPLVPRIALQVVLIGFLWWAGRMSISGPYPLRVWPIFLPVALLLISGAAAATPIVLLDSRTAGFVGQTQQGPLDQPVLVDSYAQFTATFGASTSGLANPYLAPSVAAYFVNGGQRLYIVRVPGADDVSLIGSDGGVPGARTGLQALRDIAEVAMVAIPGATSQGVQAALIVHCESVGNRFAILDPVSATDMDAVLAQRAALSTTNGFAALYFPWVQAAPAGVSLLLPPSGFVAGVVARTSPPTAATGTVNSGSSVSLALNTTQQSQLASVNINPIRYFVGQGVQVWGARTLASSTDWRYLAVRREGSGIAASIQAGTAWCLQESNDETLWAQLRTDGTNFLQGLYSAGWFKGSTPSQAYFMKCDATTMTAQDIAEGRTIMLVGFAPITAGEFIILSIVQQRASTASVTPGRPLLTLSTPRPNPFTARTTIAFDMPSTAAVTLRILDVTGRVVRTLAAGEGMASGRHDQVWDGRDDTGGGVAAGVYLVRLEAGGRVLTQRVSIMR
ncbi:MAG: FlgD immunoglobulin-like domain containing protein [Candidatus Eisenbacteria bacterium]